MGRATSRAFELPRLIRCDLLGCPSQRALASADAAALDLPRSHYTVKSSPHLPFAYLPANQQHEVRSCRHPARSPHIAREVFETNYYRRPLAQPLSPGSLQGL
jgi:hypothetical protein